MNVQWTQFPNLEVWNNPRWVYMPLKSINQSICITTLFGRMTPSFPKIAKRTSNNNAIAYWSQQTYALFYTQTRTATTVLDMSNTFSLSVKFLMIPESTISMQIPWRLMFWYSWKRPGCTRKYRLGYNPENTKN